MACHVLLIEDDADIRATFHQVLELNGHEVELAENGRRALEVLTARKSLDLILLDLILPDVNGWTVRKEQLRRGIHEDVPVVIVSGAAQDLAAEVAALGAAAGLKKPVTVHTLVKTVERYCLPRA